jgi:type II secretory ATPase GspE/PulE/Tfp pilus assembly ATPase PilB-like protein
MKLAPGVTRAFLLQHRLCPIGIAAGGEILAAVAPTAVPAALDDLSVAYRARVLTRPTSEAEIDRLIERLSSRAMSEVEVAPSFEDAERQADVRDLVHEPPVVRFVNLVIRDAFDAGASDIHLESSRDGMAVRLRVDGVLMAVDAPPRELQAAVISRLKLLADLDISERRRPQDGRIRARLDAQELDIRIATIPTVHGESVVMRLLDRGGRPVDLEALGMPDATRSDFERIARRPHGLVLVTGPTGSGKTSTLYAALQLRDAAREKTITVEDPVEYEIAGITQVPVQRASGVTFAAALRAILRQDPDVVMVGEMRDPETAEIAIQAALTGHLVLSTLHTNDALAAIPRLIDLGIPGYLVSATLDCVLAQRLVRRICIACTTEYSPDAEQLDAVRGGAQAPPRFVHGAGCPACRGTGYSGRTGLFELLRVSEDLKAAIARGAPTAELTRIAIRDGLTPLREHGWTKVVAGHTTVEEVYRAVQA